MNPLFKMQNPMNALMQKFQQFQQTFRGNANQQLQQLLSSGKVTQAQYNEAVKEAQKFQQMLNGK